MGVFDLVKEKRSEETTIMPKEYKSIRKEFTKLKETQEPILYQQSTINDTHSVKLVIDYVGDRWAKGVATYTGVYGEEINVPYTIPYSSLYTSKHVSNPPKIIRATTNPFLEEEGDLVE